MPIAQQDTKGTCWAILQTYCDMMKKSFIFYLLVVVIFVCCGNTEEQKSKNNSLDKYNVVWTSPSLDHTGSMPVGNGDIGLNVWVDQKGDICFYIGKTDSWSDNGRLLKIGKVRIKTEPRIIFDDSDFNQELDLQSGKIVITSRRGLQGKEQNIGLSVWVDANNPVVYVDAHGDTPVQFNAIIELWRTEPYDLPEVSASDLLENRSKPNRLNDRVIVEPDQVIEDKDDYIGWLHHNKKSVGFDLTNELQGLSGFFNTDPFLNRTFGAIIKGTGSEKISDYELRTSQSKDSRIEIYVLTKHPSSPEEWQNQIEVLSREISAESFRERDRKHKEWWTQFWDRSWMDATNNDLSNPDDSSAFFVSRGYVLQRFITASAGRGNYPIKFNGSIFTVPAEGTSGDPDYRRWGPGYWWQNTRLPYISLNTSGDFDLTQPFFKMYADDIYNLCKYRTKKYFNFDGAYFPECMYFWGACFTNDYGWTKMEERVDKLQDSRWHKWEWVAGPELVNMMLDYYDFTLDHSFLKDKIIPVANDIMKFFDNFYPANNEGKWVMHPSQALETWWDCTDPMPEIAGLHSITQRLIQLPESEEKSANIVFWKTIKSKIPDIPTNETELGTTLAPARIFNDKRNLENPELYAVFPFRHFAIDKPNIDWAKNALELRTDRGSSGWRQDDIFMAYLGMTDQAKENIVARATSFDENSRFPAFWGPNYDWVPDQDHGGVLMKAFQSMLLQTDQYSDKIYLLPAWPKEWNIDFKLHAPKNTVITGKVVKGELQLLEVNPVSRKNDIVICKPY
ncbi:MAG TPA: hypothetical protein DC024_05485 [Clostridiales bacterium]|nr:hypothetical protein [Clostridiales bacterium]